MFQGRWYVCALTRSLVSPPWKYSFTSQQQFPLTLANRIPLSFTFFRIFVFPVLRIRLWSFLELISIFPLFQGDSRVTHHLQSENYILHSLEPYHNLVLYNRIIYFIYSPEFKDIAFTKYLKRQMIICYFSPIYVVDFWSAGFSSKYNTE